MLTGALASLAAAAGHAALKRPVSATCFVLFATALLIETFLH